LTTPIVFLSSRVTEEDRIASLAAGGDDHLAKPVVPSLLVQTVRGRIERMRRARMLIECDGLTRLLTHSAFIEQATRRMSRYLRTSGAEASMVLIDIDHFKAVNDTYGHTEGDRVLVALAALLRRRLRRSDLIGRYGGEEFAVVLEGASLQNALEVIDDVRNEFSALRHGNGFQVTLSAGVSDLAMSSGDVSYWIRSADRALYRAKADGRNQVRAHSTT
jgi:diguanylate cyclase (GGDEF)-like protein